MYNEDIEHLCNAGSGGFKVMFAQPFEALGKLPNYYRISLNRTTVLTIKPKLTIASGNIHTYKPHHRGCYLSSERSLQFYKHYTQRNCEMECLTNYTLAQCGCVKFSMPSKARHWPKFIVNWLTNAMVFSMFCLGRNGTKICGPAKLECSYQVDGMTSQHMDYFHWRNSIFFSFRRTFSSIVLVIRANVIACRCVRHSDTVHLPHNRIMNTQPIWNLRWKMQSINSRYSKISFDDRI